MLKIVASITLFLLVNSFSYHANSQSTMTLRECAKANDALDKYLMAKEDLAQNALMNEEISMFEFNKTIESFELARSFYSIEKCMQGSDTHVYLCLIENRGNVSDCQ